MTQSKDPYSPMPTSMIGPGGTGDNSPAFQSRVRAGKRNRVPDGTAKATAQIYRPRIMDRIPHLLRGSGAPSGARLFFYRRAPASGTAGLFSVVPTGRGI